MAETRGDERPTVGVDSWLLLAVLGLLAVGLVMVFSSSQALALDLHQSAYYYISRQAIFVAIGTALLLVLSRLDYHVVRGFTLPIVIGCALLLLVVPFLGVSANGARRWFAAGPVVLQPSEIAKLGLALFAADWLVRRGSRLRSFREGFAPFGIFLAVTLVLVMLEKDLGTTMVIAVILVTCYFSAGGRKRYLFALLGGLALLVAIFILLEPYRAARLTTFLHPFQDQLGAGFQSTQGLYALGRGGVYGVGIGHSMEKYQWLPESHTDFIYAIIGEETGLLGATLVLLAFVLLAIRGYRAALRAPDRFGVVVASAITTWIAFQAMINMATVTDTLPITGVPLPLVSYGGSSIVMTLAAIGLLLNISSQGRPGPLSAALRASDPTPAGSEPGEGSQRGSAARRRSPVRDG